VAAGGRPVCGPRPGRSGARCAVPRGAETVQEGGHRQSAGEGIGVQSSLVPARTGALGEKRDEEATAGGRSRTAQGDSTGVR